MRSKAPAVTFRSADPQPTYKIAVFMVVLASLWLTPALFGQQNAHAALISPADRKAAPAFQLAAEDGTKTQLSDYRGKVVLLNFWATDCVGCVLEIPSIIQIEGAYKAQGFTALGVSMDIS